MPVERMIPITQAPQSDIPPHAYVVVRQAQVCLHCSTRHEWSEVYSKTHLKSRLHMGKYVTNLRPVRDPTEITYNLPVDILTRPPTRLPFCHECFDRVNLSHFPSPPAATLETLNINKPVAQSATKPAREHSPKRKPTIDDLAI